jgi:hypothetical protein
MQEDHQGIRDTERGETGEAKGASTPDLRLTKDLCDGDASKNPEGMLALASETGGALPLCNLSFGPGTFAFLSDAEPGTGDGGVSEDNEKCSEVIKAFIEGGRVGLVVLKKVLPNVFKTYPKCVPTEVLADCGLSVLSTGKEDGYPTFFFNPEKDGRWMLEPFGSPSKKRQRVSDSNTPSTPQHSSYISTELQSAYEALCSE